VGGRGEDKKGTGFARFGVAGALSYFNVDNEGGC